MRRDYFSRDNFLDNSYISNWSDSFEDCNYQPQGYVTRTINKNKEMPYQLSIVNTSNRSQTAVLFGYNDCKYSSNFSSGDGIKITPTQTNESYLDMLKQSVNHPFETSLIRIQSGSVAQMSQIINTRTVDSNGEPSNIPLITQSYFSSNQFNSGVLDIPYTLKVDGNTELSFIVLANSAVHFTLFPKKTFVKKQTQEIKPNLMLLLLCKS